jgi:hypothetical protein
VTETTNSPLTYQKKWDLGNRPFSPLFVKFYGFVILILEWGYLRKLHAHHAAAIWQGCMIALMTVLAVSIFAHVWMKTDRTRPFFLIYQVTFILAMVISLFGLS